MTEFRGTDRYIATEELMAAVNAAMAGWRLVPFLHAMLVRRRAVTGVRLTPGGVPVTPSCGIRETP